MIHSPYSVFSYQSSPRPCTVAPPPAPAAASSKAPVVRRVVGSVAMGLAITAPLLAPSAVAPPSSVCRVAVSGLSAQLPGLPLSGAQQAALRQASTPSPCDSPAAAQARQKL